jgi:signal transduction histidine kinase
LWFLPSDGVSVFDPRRLSINKLPPPVRVEQVTADHQTHDVSSGLRLAPLIRDLEIDYTADLAHTNRVSSMGELSASLAHEVQQPIAAAITDANTALRWLSREQPDLEEARAAASRAVQDGMRAGDIVNRVRLFFKKGTAQRELVDVNELIREMALLLHTEAAQSAVSVRTALAADLHQVMGDRVQLQQVLMNLMMNSIDAMKDGDGIRELTLRSQVGVDGHVLISVSDTGLVCRRTRQSRCVTRSLPPNLTAPAWDCGSAVLSLKRIMGACGPPLTFHAAQDSVSHCPPTARRATERFALHHLRRRRSSPGMQHEE